MKKSHSILIITILLAVILIQFKGCGNKSINSGKINENKKLTTSNVTILKKVSNRDNSITAGKIAAIKSIHHYHNVYDTIIMVSPDTCHPYIKELNSIHNNVIKKLGVVISKMDSNMVDLKSVVLNQGIIIKNDSLIMSDSTKVLLKLGKKRFWKGFRIGFGTGAVVTQAANLVR